MQNTQINLSEIVEKLEPFSGEFSDEKVERLEWFIKLEAVKAVNDDNKNEFEEILKNNDLEGLIGFVNKYSPNIGIKLIKFLKYQI